MSRSAPSRTLLHAARMFWAALVVACTFVVTSPAGAATVTIAGADPVDVKDAKYDLTAAKVVYDTTAGKLSVTAQTSAANASTTPFELYVLLGRAADGKCQPDGDASKVVGFTLLWRPGLELSKWFVSGSETFGDATSARAGAVISATAGPDGRLKDLPLDCAQVQTKTTNGEESVDVDYVNIFGTPVVDGPDQDRDGVADAKDKCPTVPGGGRDGCLTIPVKQAVRLGAKRVAIDKLVARTGDICPVKAKVKVKAGKKTVGSGVVSVTSHGSYCRAYGIVKLKKSVKKAKITVTGTGMGAIVATRKR